MSRTEKQHLSDTQDTQVINALATGVKTLARGVDALAHVVSRSHEGSQGDGAAATPHVLTRLLGAELKQGEDGTYVAAPEEEEKDPQAMSWEEIREEIEELRTAAMKRDKSQDQAGYWKLLYDCLRETHGMDVTELKEKRGHNGSKITVLNHEELVKALDCAKRVY